MLGGSRERSDRRFRSVRDSQLSLDGSTQLAVAGCQEMLIHMHGHWRSTTIRVMREDFVGRSLGWLDIWCEKIKRKPMHGGGEVDP